jgi:hypothetical protein
MSSDPHRQARLVLHDRDLSFGYHKYEAGELPIMKRCDRLCVEELNSSRDEGGNTGGRVHSGSRESET